MRALQGHSGDTRGASRNATVVAPYHCATSSRSLIHSGSRSLQSYRGRLTSVGPSTHAGDLEEAPDLGPAQIEPRWPLGEYTSRCNRLSNRNKSILHVHTPLLQLLPCPAVMLFADTGLNGDGDDGTFPSSPAQGAARGGHSCVTGSTVFRPLTGARQRTGTPWILMGKEPLSPHYHPGSNAT